MDRHVYGVFLRIKEKNNPNSRIYVMELPTGKFFSGIIPTAAILNVKLRDIISVDLKDVLPVDDVQNVVSHHSYGIEPCVYPNDIDVSL